MNLLSKFAAGCALLALMACNNPSDALDGDTTDLNSAANAAPGLIGDQTSPAYFQQAIGDRVLFAVNEANLSSEAQSILLAQANWLLANTDYNATIEGHADEQGTREYNLALGAQRANAARDFLISRGVAGTRLKTVSYGKERPIEICSEESCYAKNRRAVTVLLGGLTG